MKLEDDTQIITPNLSLIRKDGIILDTLVDHNQLPKDWDRDHLISFFFQEDFYLVLYFSKYDDKGFQMFIVNDFARNVEDLVILSNTFSELIARGNTNSLFKKALYRIDNLIYMSTTFRAISAKNEING